MTDGAKECISSCWSRCPANRPDFRTIRHCLKPMTNRAKPNYFDNVLQMMDKYTSDLESIVADRTQQLLEEKKRTDELLYEMLPRYIADKLKSDGRVDAESIDGVTVYFGDIVEFTSVAARSTPLQLVDFLNDLYTCFDEVLEHYPDVYKVETIGDAYMVASGLVTSTNAVANQETSTVAPAAVNNCSRIIHHAAQMASMALEIVRVVKGFKIRHLPDLNLLIRIGIHCGPVCAGVVGSKMPRYCLFGDTVNTASRLQSTSLPLMIHCSQEFARVLENIGGFDLQLRGKIQLKGKGELMTYWLLGEIPGSIMETELGAEAR